MNSQQNKKFKELFSEPVKSKLNNYFVGSLIKRQKRTQEVQER